MKYRIVFILGIILFSTGVLFAQVEICDNAMDDDNDGLVDLNDPDCDCPAVTPISMIPNPSFEEMDCCPFADSQMECATDWIQASDPTTDYIHTCDWLGYTAFPPPQPFPDGEGIMGFRNGSLSTTSGNYEPRWKEYAGACLLRPLLKDITYRFEFDLGFIDAEISPPINISFFGTSDCANLPFGTFGCPSLYPEWNKISEVFVGAESTNSWVKSFIEITPEQDIYAIAIGPDCPLNTIPKTAFYFFDNLILSEVESFGSPIQEMNHPCEEDFAMVAPENLGTVYQWYKSGIALLGETNSTLGLDYGPGIYQVRIQDGSSCVISEDYEYSIPSFSATPQASICEGDEYEFGGSFLTNSGFYVDTFLNQNNCDSIVALELEIIGSEFYSLEASILSGETFQLGEEKFSEPGEHLLTFASSLGCDSLVLLELSNFDVFIPTAFSPNFDGLNDYFEPYSETGRIASVEMEIYDRWGGLRYKGDRWDGSQLNPGVYVYIMTIQFDYGAVKEYAGSITLLR